MKTKILGKSVFQIPVYSMVVILGACGSVPVPESRLSWSDLVPGRSTQIADQGSDAETINGPALANASEQNIPDLKTARDYWRYAVSRLQVGDVTAARTSLDKALEISPRNKVAHKLLRQLEIDPVQELGAKHFMHKVAPGESLSRLAKDHLNDSLKFYLLARYNNIQNPDEVKIGQQLRIPGDAPIIAEVKIDKKRKNELLMQAEVAFNEESYEQVIELLSPALSEKKAAKKYGRDFKPMRKLLLNAYVGAAQNHREAGANQAAINMLALAKDMDPANGKVTELLAAIDVSKDLDDWYAESAKLRETNPDKSQQLLGQIIAVRPGYRDAKQQLSKLDGEVKAYYYREALKHQRSQKLDEAIALWDKLLGLEPANENAKLYRARAMELKVNLQKFVSDQ